MSLASFAHKPRVAPGPAEWDDPRIAICRVKWDDGLKLVASLDDEPVAFAECVDGLWHLHLAETEGEPEARMTREADAREWLEDVARDVADDWRGRGR